MNVDKLFDAIGNIDDEYIVKASDNYISLLVAKKKSNFYKRIKWAKQIAAVAASFVIIITGVIFLPDIIKEANPSLPGETTGITSGDTDSTNMTDTDTTTKPEIPIFNTKTYAEGNIIHPIEDKNNINPGIGVGGSESQDYDMAYDSIMYETAIIAKLRGEDAEEKYYNYLWSGDVEYEYCMDPTLYNMIRYFNITREEFEWADMEKNLYSEEVIDALFSDFESMNYALHNKFSVCKDGKIYTYPYLNNLAIPELNEFIGDDSKLREDIKTVVENMKTYYNYDDEAYKNDWLRTAIYGDVIPYDNTFSLKNEYSKYKYKITLKSETAFFPAYRIIEKQDDIDPNEISWEYHSYQLGIDAYLITNPTDENSVLSYMSEFASMLLTRRQKEVNTKGTIKFTSKDGYDVYAFPSIQYFSAEHGEYCTIYLIVIDDNTLLGMKLTETPSFFCSSIFDEFINNIKVEKYE